MLFVGVVVDVFINCSLMFVEQAMVVGTLLPAATLFDIIACLCICRGTLLLHKNPDCFRFAFSQQFLCLYVMLRSSCFMFCGIVIKRFTFSCDKLITSDRFWGPL